MDADIIITIVYMAVIGAGIGTFTGLIPGIHVNTLAAMMLASYGTLGEILDPIIPENSLPICISACIVSAGIVHSFVDYVPSVFIGAPDPDDVLSMLPGHRLLYDGRGMAAIRAAAIGSCVGACLSVLIALPLQYLLMKGLGDYFDSITMVVLIIVILLMIFREKDVRSAAIASAIMLISGILGLICMDFSIPCEGVLGEGTLLFPLLTGLFGIPTMLQSLKNGSIPEQKDDERYPVGILPGVKGVLTGIITGWFPGITATTGAVLSSMVTPEKRPEGFISMTASIGTAASVMMIVTLSVTGKGRSGTMLTVSEILGDSAVGLFSGSFLLLLLTASIAALLGYNLTIGCGKILSHIASKIDSVLLNKACIIIVTVLVLLMTGPFGLMILVISALVGFIPIYFNTGRIYLTGCLLIPTLLTYLGIRESVGLIL